MLKLEYQLTEKPDAAGLTECDNGSRAMVRLLTVSARELGAGWFVRATVWLMSSVKYRRITKKDGKWFVTYHYPLC